VTFVIWFIIKMLRKRRSNKKSYCIFIWYNSLIWLGILLHTITILDKLQSHWAFYLSSLVFISNILKPAAKIIADSLQRVG
jgi:hypothetical protein